MNKSQLIEALSNHFEGNKKTAQHALESVLDTITREVARGEKVAITGFGAFEKVIRPARAVRNPRSREQGTTQDTAVPKFRAGSELRAAVSGEKKPSEGAGSAGAQTSTATKKDAQDSATGADAATGEDSVKTTSRSRPAASTPSTSGSAAKRQAAKKSPAKQDRATKTSTTAKKSAAEKKASAAEKSSAAERKASTAGDSDSASSS